MHTIDQQCCCGDTHREINVLNVLNCRRIWVKYCIIYKAIVAQTYISVRVVDVDKENNH